MGVIVLRAEHPEEVIDVVDRRAHHGVQERPGGRGAARPAPDRRQAVLSRSRWTRDRNSRRRRSRCRRLPGVVLDRGEAVPKLIGRHEDFLIVTGLGGIARDVGAVTGDSAHVFSLGGAMGAPCMMGLGLALAQPEKQRAGRDRRRRSPDERRRARHHRGDEPAQPRDRLHRQRPLRRDRLAEEPHQPRRRPGENRDRLPASSGP